MTYLFLFFVFDMSISYAYMCVNVYTYDMYLFFFFLSLLLTLVEGGVGCRNGQCPHCAFSARIPSLLDKPVHLWVQLPLPQQALRNTGQLWANLDVPNWKQGLNQHSSTR